ncbi:MAG: ABC transporter permease [Phycisphaerales bacterium]|nr:ABC transporter permease [Planctomycetota bacterium]MBL6997129.1 ABC transporter permease [Phycisphaerales bacterium]
MHKILTVAWREFRHTAMTKAFVLGAIVMPILMMALFILVIPLMMDSNTTPLQGTIVLVAPNDVVVELETQISKGITSIEEVADQLPDVITNDPIASAMLGNNSQTDISILVAPNENLDSLKDQVRNGDYVGLIVVPDSIIQDDESDEQLSLFIPSSFSPNHMDILTRATSQSVVNVRLRRLGHEPKDIHDLVRRPRTIATRLSDDGGEERDNEFARRIIPMAFMMLLWIATFTSGNCLLTTTIEEKSNKVMEVLLSAISPMQLLAGKILGQAGVSAVILCMYGSAALAGLVTFALLDLIPFAHLLMFVIFFVIAYFMIATIMAAVGSAVSELRDAQSLMGPVMLILIIPLALWPVLAEHPNGMIATISSFTPPLLPFVMILRVTASTEPVALWQVILSIGIGLGSVIAMLWMCARIFRIGILIQGKPPNILQLVKWIRQG